MAKAALSLQSISRKIRHTISKDILRDIDVVACHPSIMYNILRPIYNFEFEALGLYLHNDDNKNKIINELIRYNPTHNKDSVKDAICAVLNGGGYVNFENPTQWYVNYYNQAQEVLSKIVKQLDDTIPAYREDSELKKGKNYPFLNGSIVNHVLLDYENRIAFYMRKVLEEKKFKVVALTHDGCMVEENENLTIEILREIEKVLEENNLRGIKLKYKDMNENFSIASNELEIIDCDNIAFEKTIDYDNKDIIYKTLQEGDSGLSKLFHHKVKNIIKTVSMTDFDGYVWNGQTRLWDKQTKEIFTNRITDVLIELANPFLKEAEDELIAKQGEGKETIKILKDVIKYRKRIIDYIRSSKGCKSIWEKARTLLYDRTFVDNLNNTSYEYPIRGGYKINLKTKEVSLRNRNDFWDFESPASYVAGETEDKKRLFKYLKSVCCEEGPNGEDKGISDENAHFTKWLFKLFGYSLTKEVSDRHLYICHGKGQNSKSVVMEMISNIMVLDRGYSPLSKGAILAKDDRRSGATPELMPFQYCRLGAVIETDEKQKLDSSIIKSLTGNDLIKVRALYQNEITIKPSAKIFLISNHKPEFNTEDTAMVDRVVFIPFSQRFNKTPENTKKVQDMIANDKDYFFS